MRATPHWLSDDETCNIEFVIVCPGVLRDASGRWFATDAKDASFINIFGPFGTRQQVTEWQSRLS